MSGTTSIHGLPYPFETDKPDGSAQIQALANAVDQQLPSTADSQPDPLPGLIWRDPSTGYAYISDGTSWYPLSGAVFGSAAFGLIQADSTVVSTNAAGGLSSNIVFPIPYQNIPTVVVCSGDSSHSVQVAIWENAVHKTDFDCICYLASGSAAANTNVRINWIAIGT